MEVILGTFFAHQIALKMLHFQTKIYSYHVIVDAYLQRFAINFDKFMEVLQGTHPINLKKISLSVNLTDDESVKVHLDKIIFFMRYLEIDGESLKPELQTIIDDMIGEIQQLKYLMKFE